MYVWRLGYYKWSCKIHKILKKALKFSFLNSGRSNLSALTLVGSRPITYIDLSLNFLRIFCPNYGILLSLLQICISRGWHLCITIICGMGWNVNDLDLTFKVTGAIKAKYWSLGILHTRGDFWLFAAELFPWGSFIHVVTFGSKGQTLRSMS